MDDQSLNTGVRAAGCTCGMGAADSAKDLSLTDLLDTLERLQDDFGQRLTGIAPPDAAELDAGRDLEAVDLLQPFVEARRHLGAVLSEERVSQTGHDGASQGRAANRKRFFTVQREIALDSFEGPVLLRVHHRAQRRPAEHAVAPAAQ